MNYNFWTTSLATENVEQQNKEWISQMQIPLRQVTPWQEEESLKVVGSNPGAGEGCFLAK